MRKNASLKFGVGLATVLPLIVAGCGATAVSARTVSYFQAHPKEREALFKRCADDPGTLGKTAECINASRAEEIEGIGSFRDLPPMQFPPVPGRRAKDLAPVPDPSGAPSR